MNSKNINPVIYTVIVVLFGWSGLHKFINGKTGIGFAYLFTFGLCGIGWLIDIVKAITQIQNNKINSSDLLEWQKLVMENSPNYLVSKIELENATNRTISNNYRIMQDCIELIYDTVNPKVFFSRMELLKTTTEHLFKFKPYIVLNNSIIPTSLSAIENEQRITTAFIERYYKKICSDISKLKTEKGRENQYQKFYDTLMQYKNKMNNNNIEYVEHQYNKFKAMK